MMKKRDYEMSYREMYAEDLYEDGKLDGGFDDEASECSELNPDGESDYSCEDSDDTCGSDGESDNESKGGNKDEVCVPGIRYLPNGKPIYSGIYHNNGRNPNGDLVHNDLVYVFERLRKENITSFEVLQSTDVFWDDRNLYEAYGRALHNGVRYMVGSGNLRGLVIQQKNRSNGVVDLEEATEYCIEKFMFRPSFFKAATNSAYDCETTVKIILSFVSNAVGDCAKKHKVVFADISEFGRDLENGTVRENYATYDVSLDALLGSGDDSGKRRIDTIPDRDEDFKKVELLSCVNAYTVVLGKRKVPKVQIDIFRIKATRFLTEGVNLTPAEIATELGISVQTVYSNLKKIAEFYNEFAMYIAS